MMLSLQFFTVSISLFVIMVLLMICVYVCYSDETREKMRNQNYDPPVFSALARFAACFLILAVISGAIALVVS